MTRLIVQMAFVPSMVLGLLRSGDPQVKKSFASDRTFTIALYKAFEVFKTLSANSQVAGQELGNESQVTDAIEEIILASDFSVRDVRTLNGTGSENGLSEDVFTTWNELDVFADFTGRISFETLERIITLWNIQKAEDDFGAAINLLMSDNRVQGSENPFIDLREYVMSYTY
ncbi:hypothetical protein LZ32DRAFT_657563 [Colletotrichum eremochloae]|nr:hypothetical protein LZ32DRAFT_657563 [Colletotrichum eremochloae]